MLDANANPRFIAHITRMYQDKCRERRHTFMGFHMYAYLARRRTQAQGE